MKTSFLRILPLTAAVLLATSCSKDENNDKEIVNNSPENVVIEKNVVKIPFSVKVNQDKTLSKIAYSGSESSVTVSGVFYRRRCYQRYNFERNRHRH